MALPWCVTPSPRTIEFKAAENAIANIEPIRLDWQRSWSNPWCCSQRSYRRTSTSKCGPRGTFRFSFFLPVGYVCGGRAFAIRAGETLRWYRREGWHFLGLLDKRSRNSPSHELISKSDPSFRSLFLLLLLLGLLHMYRWQYINVRVVGRPIHVRLSKTLMRDCLSLFSTPILLS